MAYLRSTARGARRQARSLRAALILLAASALIPAAAHAATISVPAGGNLQAALDSAQPGDTILLEAGATFRGPFSLPNKPGEGWITVRTSAPDSALPGPDARVTPAYAGVMPKIVTAGAGEPALRTEPSAHHFRFVGVEFKPTDAGAMVYDLIRLGEVSEQRTLDVVPHHLVFDRCYIHGDPAGQLRRGVALNSASTEIVNSYLSEFKVAGLEAQAILGWNGPGPFRIVNNYLEGAGENVMFGGSLAVIPNLVPSDIEIRRNHFRKPPEWRGRYTVKNIFELKNARRVVVDGNLFEHNWADAQNGYAVLFTVRGEDGLMPWATVEDVQFTNNILRHSGAAINILGRDSYGASQQAARITIRNNVFEDVDGAAYASSGNFLQIASARDVVVEHNTVLHNGTVITAYGEPSTGFVFRDNLAAHNDYGIIGDGTGVGLATLSRYLPDGRVERNVLAGGPDWKYPATNFFPATLDAARFADRAAGNYRLAADSPYKGAASDGKDLGCDFDALAAAQSGAPTSTPTPTPTPTPTATPTPAPTATPTPTPTATPTPTPTPSTQSGALIAAAHRKATAHAQSPAAEAAEVSALAGSVGEAYAAYVAERGAGAQPDAVMMALLTSFYFSRASEALSLAGRYPVGVQNRLQITASRLGQSLDLLSAGGSGSGGIAHAHAPSTSAPPVIGSAATASGASLARVVSPNSLGVIVGDAGASPLAGATVPAGRLDADSLPLELGGASVTIAGRAAPLVYVSPGRVGFRVPGDLPAGEAEVLVTSQDGYVSRGTVTVAPHAPGFFTRDGSGTGAGVVLNAGQGTTDGALDITTPWNLGEDKRTRLSIFGTGITSNPQLNPDARNDVRRADGTVVANFAESVAVEARLADGRTMMLSVGFVGPTSAAGVDQVDVILMPELRGAGRVTLTLIMGGQITNAVTVEVK